MPLAAGEGDAVREAAFAALDRLHPGGALGVAVSGGGDSLALLLLAAAWARARGVRLEVATVDHRLRPEAAAEAAAVAARCARLGLVCATLVWSGWDGRGNLQAAARAARVRLIGRWAADRALGAVATGHTLDDQAETVVMRLAQGAGVDGLAGIAPVRRLGGVTWLRPLLGVGRAAIRRWLADRGERWADDPSNADARFHRARTRAALAAAGVDAAALARTAAAMARARAALEAGVDALAVAAAAAGALGEVRLARAPLLAAPAEIAIRLLGRALAAASGDARAAPAAALLALREAIAAGPSRGRTLRGCVLSWGDARVTVAREPAAAFAAPPPAGGLWDGRWRVVAGAPGEIRALGPAGAAALAAAARAGAWRAPPAWRAAPAAARLSSPALWRDGALASAPAAAYGSGLEAAPVAAVGRAVAPR